MEKAVIFLFCLFLVFGCQTIPSGTPAEQQKQVYQKVEMSIYHCDLLEQVRNHVVQSFPNPPFALRAGELYLEKIDGSRYRLTVRGYLNCEMIWSDFIAEVRLIDEGEDLYCHNFHAIVEAVMKKCKLYC